MDEQEVEEWVPFCDCPKCLGKPLSHTLAAAAFVRRLPVKEDANIDWPDFDEDVS